MKNYRDNTYQLGESVILLAAGLGTVLGMSPAEYGPADAFKALGAKPPKSETPLSPQPAAIVADVQAAQQSRIPRMPF